MPKPLVSIVMITYNHRPYIRKAIESVLAQKTNFPFELLIGEDCSSDGTQEITNEYAQAYPSIIRIINSSHNVGMKKNWYRTNMASRGKYIAYCEGDDYWHRDDKLQLQVDYMEGNPQCGMVYSDYDWYFISRCRIINNTLKPYDKKLLRSPQIEDILTRKVDIRTCTVLAKRETAIGILKADPTLHFNDTFKLADIQLWAEISLVSEIHYIDESLATYQILNESTSQSRDRKKGTRFRISVAEMYLYLCHKHNLSEFIKKRYEKSRLQETLKLAFIEQNQKLAESAIRQNPNLSFKNWLRYFGTRYSIFRPIIILADTMLKHVRPKKWYHS